MLAHPDLFPEDQQHFKNSMSGQINVMLFLQQIPVVTGITIHKNVYFISMGKYCQNSKKKSSQYKILIMTMYFVG